MILKIHYSYFSLSALVALSQKTVGLLESRFPDNEIIKSVLPQIHEAHSVSLQAIGSSTKNLISVSVKQSDTKRDNCFMSLKNHVEAGLRRENDVYQNACNTLWPFFVKNNVKMYGLPYDDQTSATRSLIKDLKLPENKEHIQTVNVVEWLNELETANNEFIDVQKQRSVSRIKDDTIRDAEAFKKLRQLLDMLESVLNTLYLINDPEGIQDAVKEINQYISEANTAARQSN
nr:DUF6261 family protein [uncultured Carboxylicivirga sp.]